MRQLILLALGALALMGCSSSPEAPPGMRWEETPFDYETTFYRLVPDDTAGTAACPPPAAAPCPPPARGVAAAPAPPPPCAAPARVPVVPAGVARPPMPPPPPPPPSAPARASVATPRPPPPAAPPAASREADLRSKLDILQQLRDQGVLTEEEHRAKRQQVIDAYNP